MEIAPQSEAFITLKDQKQNFRTNPTCRLLNPNKGDLGRVSKQLLQDINSRLRHKLGVNQWRNTSDVIQWFKGIENKKEHAFIQFDVVDFYPSISEQLLDSALEFAATHISITEQDRKIIKAAKHILLYSQGAPWVKKGDNGMFDNTMGCWDGAETCELVGLFMLQLLQ